MSFRRELPCLCALTLGLLGCPPKSEPGDESTGGEVGASESTAPEPTGSEGGVPDDGGQRPRETEWMTFVDALPFPADVASLTIGRLEFDGNFANRGDVEVLFDQDAPVITIEGRIYDFTDLASFVGEGDIPGTSQRFSLWAYATTSNPDKPGAMKDEDDCTQGAWKDGCKVHVYYDGQVQPVRSGVDLRVHLPRAYRGALTVATEDNLGEPSYPRVSDVVIDGLCGSGEVSLAQGRASIEMCDELTPTPTCPAAQVAECEAFTDMGEDAAWSPLCPCGPELFGQLLVESRAPWAGDITIDMPDTTWVNVHVGNEETDKPHACVPAIENCAAGSCVASGDDMFSAGAEYNYPGPAAPAGAGYNITAVSAGCGPVQFFAAPDDWVDMNSVPMEVERGHVRVCTDCL